MRESRNEGRCFICRIVSDIHGRSHQIIYEDPETIVFLNRYPTLLGYCLVAPTRHVEDWVHQLDDAEFLALQHVVHRVARAVAAVVPTERMYSLSLGSQQETRICAGTSRHFPRECPMTGSSTTP